MTNERPPLSEEAITRALRVSGIIQMFRLIVPQQCACGGRPEDMGLQEIKPMNAEHIMARLVCHKCGRAIEAVALEYPGAEECVT